MPHALSALALVSNVFCGAIFGFFYAWVCSTMWGLDAADPVVAIQAMQAMNASVRNAIFFPAFFLTPVVLISAALVGWRLGRHRSARGFIGAAGVYLAGAFAVTMTVNVPMNEALAATPVPVDGEEALRIWNAYSGPWQNWNIIRTFASGLALLMSGYALIHLKEGSK
ncbi:Uncharacterized membrane protein [Poseidonocella pacifica]|uniref:Uncharacterized membrane protein n=1 Tax=Poseidonocella pacifica TaxID=871651 RepID=A0A1I0VWR8_9RHOB|nr:anthrone oxygenase family protein [Poseidonocella pacifica]SFA80744.1 Uncharacterized membrane protein [Poseidonocella pacifica]